MATLADIEADLPWGLHDATLEALTIDWLHETATMTLQMLIDGRANVVRPARIEVTGLFFCAVQPPTVGHGYSAMRPGGLWIHGGEGAGPCGPEFPALPAGVFLHHLFVFNWNRAIHIAGRDARLEWLGPEVQRPKRAPTR